MKEKRDNREPALRLNAADGQESTECVIRLRVGKGQGREERNSLHSGRKGDVCWDSKWRTYSKDWSLLKLNQ